MASENLGRNLTFPIYNADGTSFHNLEMKKATYDSVVMSLSDKITGDVYYKDNALTVTMSEYIEYNGTKFILVNPPTIVREGLAKDNSELKGMTKYSFEFYHPMCLLSNLPFTDVAVTNDELRYKSQDKTFFWIGTCFDYIDKLNKNLENTQWVVVASDSQESREMMSTLSDVLSFDNVSIADALKTSYETWGVPYVISRLTEGQYFDKNNVDYYSQEGGSKRFVVILGTPSNEIIDPDGEYGTTVNADTLATGRIYYNTTPINVPSGKKFIVESLTEGATPIILNSNHNGVIGTTTRTFGEDTMVYVGLWTKTGRVRYFFDGEESNVFVFKFGQGVGLKNNSRTPKNNKIVTRIAGYGSTDNIPYGYPQIPWTGDRSATQTPDGYPIYTGIVNGQSTLLIKHPFTRTHLMPAIYSETVNKKVNPYATGYDPTIELIDYYDADSTYPNPIIENAPSYEMKEFEEIKPELGSAKIIDAKPINDKDQQVATDWDDSIDGDGNYVQGYFQITLPTLGFDIYACAAITQEMQINMRSGACMGCTFTVQVDWEDYKANFYNSDGEFEPYGTQRDLTKYPNSTSTSITVIVQKDTSTFGTLMPNIYQQPKKDDEFVILGISLPLTYIKNAETRLAEEMKSYMLGNNIYYYEYPLKFDEHFLATHTNVLEQIKPNTIIRFLFGDDPKPLMLYVKQLTVKYGYDVLPQYDITLTDNIEVTLNQIGQAIENVEKLSSLINAIRQGGSGTGSAGSGSGSGGGSDKLSKVNDDTANGLIGFLKGFWVKVKGLFGIDANGNASVNGLNVAGDANFEGFLQAVRAMMNQITSMNYTGGDSGTGFIITNDRNGHSYLAVDELFVRMKAVFNELEIKKRTYSGGNFIFSPAGSKIYRVDYINASGETIGYAEYNVPWVLNGEAITMNDLAYAARQKVRIEVDLTDVTTYRCYIVSDDGTTTIENLWQAYDQAMCQTFDVNTTERELSNEVERKMGNIFYWRLVTGIGTSILDDGKEYAYVDLSNTNPGVSGGYLPTGPNGVDADFPCAGDVIVCMGHRGTDADGSGVERMNVIEVETVGSDAPAIKEYRGINTFSLDGKRKTMISPTSGNEFYAKRFYTETDYSEPIPNTVERGLWQQYDAQGQPMKYYNFNLVSHKGTTWLCIVEDGFYTADGTYTFTDIEGKTWNIPYNKGDRIFTCLEPSDANNTVWQKHTWKGASSYKSTVFIRQNTVPTAPTAEETTVGGITYNTYDHPVPPPSSGWTDGAPDGEAILWSVTRIFTTDGSEPQQSTWSPPRAMTDTADFDVEFSSYENPSAPSGHPNTNAQWGNTASSATIWMATSEKHNGVWSAWQVSKIKGESGVDAAVASLSHSVISIQCDNTGKAIASGSEDVYVYLSTKGSDLTGINHSYSGSTSATYRKLSGNSFRLSWSSGATITDGTLTITATGTDSNGNSQTGYASIRVIAEKQGIKGTDAYSINATPASLIFTQSETAPYGLVDASKTSIVNVVQGTQSITSGVTITTRGTSGCSQSVSGMTLTITPTRSGSSSAGYTYPESGYADFRVTVGGMYYDIRIQFYCNLLGTWKQSVEAGTETIVAKKISYVVNEGDDSKTIAQSTATFNSVRDAANSFQKWKVDTTNGYAKDQTNVNTRIDNAFEAVQELREEVDGELQNYSTIEQTANSISLSVTNLKNEVKTNTGIDITNGTIDLIAGKVNFKASNGTSTNPYMSIGSDGKLTVDSIKATNGDFTGKVTATSGEFTGTVYADSGEFKGDIIVTSGSNTVKINSNGFEGRWGNDGIRLNSNGLMRWHPDKNDWVNMYGGRYVRVVSTSTSLTDNDDFLICAGSGYTVTLPTGSLGKIITIRNIGGGTIRIIPRYSYQKIWGDDEYSAVELNYQDRAELVFYNNNWYWNAMTV